MRAHTARSRWLALPLLFAAVLAVTSCSAAIQGTQAAPAGQGIPTPTPLGTAAPPAGQAISTITPLGTSAPPGGQVTSTPSPLLGTSTAPAAPGTSASPSAQGTPTPFMTNGFEVGSFTNYRSSYPPLEFVGVATSKSDTPLYSVEVAITLMDAQGNVVATASDPASVYVALPNMVVPFSVAFSESVPSEWQEVKIQIQGQKQSTFPDNYLDLRTEGTTIQPSGTAFDAVGRVVNTGQGTTDWVRVAVVTYDSNGKVVDVGSDFTELDEIRPGGSSPFAVHLSNTKAVPARYDVVVQGLVPVPTIVP